ncbi:hypothetical protein AB0M02_39765 [Actinoplanes sp. NPDC051861]|uniref:hypothetical protein n=1 Tax=Actinoplanes sp. NPDC051861 TaxID=3155170 RepID=UPI0034218C0A
MAARRRWVTGLAGAALAALLVTGGVVAGRQFRSPQQAAADAEPPAPSLISVAAEQRVLAEPVVLRGQVKPGPKVVLALPAAAAGADSVVTSVAVRAGDRLHEGMLVLDVSGEPMFTLDLPFPLYRDVVGGMKGPDVAEIQRALRRLGFYVPRSSTLDEPTQQALTRLYRRLGYDPIGGDRAAAKQVSSAEQALQEAQAALAAAPDAAARSAAQAAADAARRSLAGARLAAGAGVPRSRVLLLDRAGRKVTKVGVKVGTVLTDPAEPVLELDGQAGYITASATARQAKLIAPKQRVTITDEGSDTGAEGTILSVADEVAAGSAEDEDKQPGYQVRIRADGDTFDKAAGRSLRIDVAVSGSDAEVLAVPVTAIWSRPDGSTFASIARPDGTTGEVTVETGKTAGGWVEIRPDTEGELVEGTPVVVGSDGNPE